MYTTAVVSLKRLAGSYQHLSFGRASRPLLPYLGSAFILWLLLRHIGFQAIWGMERKHRKVYGLINIMC